MSLFKDVSEVQAFIVWCRDQKIQGVEVGEVKVSFSPLAFVPEMRREPKDPAETPKPEKTDPGTGYPERDLYP